jgi:hypothetical protein
MTSSLANSADWGIIVPFAKTHEKRDRLRADDRMKATVYLHIGMHKTGTTSVQATLFNNRVPLRNHNINYLSINQNHSETLYPLVCDNPHLYHVNRSAGIDTEEKAAWRNERISRALRQELESNTCSRIVISGEDLIHLTPEGIERLRQKLLPFADRFRIVVYVRDPYDFINSAFQQKLRAGLTYEQLIASPPLPRYRRIQKFIKIFGREHVDIRIFEPTRFVNRDLIADFLAAIDAGPELAKTLDIVRANEALSHEAALILNEVNKRYPRVQDGIKNPCRAADLPQWLAAVAGQRFQCPSSVLAAAEPKLADDLRWLHTVLGERVFAAQVKWVDPSPNWNGETLVSLSLLINDMANAIAEKRKAKTDAALALRTRGALPALGSILRRWTKPASN